MALTLAAVLAHRALLQSDPLLLAGDPSRRLVRWVHSSEIYDIAPLLRGGELLLTTGLGLERSTPQERQTYVRSLADKEVAGLALELSDTFSEPPAEMIAQARRLDLPFIALRKVYPFVEVTEQVNSAIVDSSIVRLRHADEVGRALSRVLAGRGGLDALTHTLADLLARPVVLTDPTGVVLAAAVDDEMQHVLREPSATAVVSADGILLGGLAVGDGASADDLLLAAMDRAPEIFALEVLRARRQPLLAGRERRDLLGHLLTGALEDPAALSAHASTSRIRADVLWAGMAVGPSDSHRGLSLAQDVARESGAQVLAAEIEGTAYALLALPCNDSRGAMARVHQALRRTQGPLAAIGPAVAAASAGRSLRSARQALLLGATGHGTGRLLVAEELVVERLLAAVPDVHHLADLVDEQLGCLLRAPRAGTLLATLEEYLACGCSKAATARALHLRRQSVHQRLSRIAGLLGHDLTDPGRQTALRLALAARPAAR